jgi:type IV secretion system protein VirB6
MQETPFENIGNDFGTAFGTGISQATSNALSAIAAPLTALVVLWIIIQGILVMRGDMDARGGVTRIIKIALVVGVLTSTSLYTQYVTTVFTSTLPNWVASSITNNSSIQNTPTVFDEIWNTTVHEITSVQAQLNFYDVVDEVTLAVVQIVIALILLVTFAVYEIAQVMTGVVVAVGPFVLAGYLFDATKAVADRWLGKLLGLAILSLLINIVMNIILSGEQLYLRSVVNNPNSGTGAVTTEIQILIELCMFFAIGAFIVVSLPGIAAAIGGGIGFNAGSIGRTLTNTLLAGAAVGSRAGGQAPPPRGEPITARRGAT